MPYGAVIAPLARMVGLPCGLVCILQSNGAGFYYTRADLSYAGRQRGAGFMMRPLRITAILLVCGLVALWMSQQYRDTPPAEPATLIVATLPDFTLPDLDDRPRSITEWSGRSLVINFWATWCAPCRREMPLLQSLQDERADGSLQVIGVALDNLADAKRFATQIRVTYPVLYGEEDGTVVAESLGDDFIGLPFSAFVAPDGEILALVSGELQADDLHRIVAEMDAVASGQSSAAEARARLSAD